VVVICFAAEIFLSLSLSVFAFFAALISAKLPTLGVVEVILNTSNPRANIYGRIQSR